MGLAYSHATSCTLLRALVLLEGGRTVFVRLRGLLALLVSGRPRPGLGPDS